MAAITILRCQFSTASSTVWPLCLAREDAFIDGVRQRVEAACEEEVESIAKVAAETPGNNLVQAGFEVSTKTVVVGASYQLGTNVSKWLTRLGPGPDKMIPAQGLC